MADRHQIAEIDAKQIARSFFDRLCSGDFEGAFASMSPDATWSVIGDTAVSGTLDKAGMLEKQAPMLASFKEAPVVGVDEIIAEGNRAVVLAHCKGVGPTGPYEQKRYVFVLRIDGGMVVEVVEYLDTVAVETAICGNKLVPASATLGDDSERGANIALATRMMADFGGTMDGWYDNLHDDIVLEFPFGSSVGMPVHVEGKAAASALFAATVAAVQVRFHDVIIHPMQDPHRLVLEYKGYSEPAGKIYDQTYIGIQEYRDGKMILFKEYWNAIVVDRTFGDLSALASVS